MAVSLAAGASAWSVPALAPVVPVLAAALGVPLRTMSADAVAITFDDGPHPHGTPAVLDLLAAAGSRATFFLVGEQVRAFPSLAAEIVAAGHEVALHGDRHRTLLSLSRRAFADDIDRGTAIISELAGAVPVLHRPPFGIYSWPALGVLEQRALSPLLWSRWGRDWSARATEASITRRVTRDLSAGDVLLLHDADWYSDAECWRGTVAALPRVLDAIELRGLRATAVSEAGTSGRLE